MSTALFCCADEWKAWADFKDGEPYAFDPEDIDYVEPIAGGDAICRSCGSAFATED